MALLVGACTSGGEVAGDDDVADYEESQLGQLAEDDGAPPTTELPEPIDLDEVELLPPADLPDGVTVDSSLPVPANFRAFSGDQELTITWDPVDSPEVVGYYITYRKAGTDDPYLVRQQLAAKDEYLEYPTAVQLQPLENNVAYEINLQAAAGTYVNVGESEFARGDGRLSPTTEPVIAAPSGARVAQMRSTLTGFFDDFAIAAGPFDELKWNHAATACVKPSTGGAFVNNQFHVHNMLASTCDRAGMASRPRATFNMAGASEETPAIVEMDLDGITQPRDTWYLDFIPLNSRVSRHPIDITSHNDLFDEDDEDAGNMLRVNANSGGINVAYYDENRQPQKLYMFADDSGRLVCEPWLDDYTVTYDSCRTGAENQTPGLSPLPQLDIALNPIPNVRRQWQLQFTDTKLHIYVDSFFVGAVDLPERFAAEDEYTVHSTVFSYNTGKQHRTVVPGVVFMHWDNFGFSGPAPSEVVYNYIEEQDGMPLFGTNTPAMIGQTNAEGEEFSALTQSALSGDRQTNVVIADPIGDVIDGKAKLFLTLQPLGYSSYAWESSHSIDVNGTSYAFPDPRNDMINPKDDVSTPTVPLAIAIDIDASDLVTGDNSIKFNLGESAGVLNVHIELPYSLSDDSRPEYTAPIDIFEHDYWHMTMPPMSDCDYYWFIERDLGLAYEDGRENVVVNDAGCRMLDIHSQ